jgi:hypothetical protein
MWSSGYAYTGIRGRWLSGARYALAGGADNNTTCGKESLIGNGDDFELSVE